MSILIHYSKFRTSPTTVLCRLFQAAAYDTWERIAFSRTRPRMRVYETSITQNLVYEMNLIKWKFNVHEFSIYESTNEAAHGDDLEICIVQRDGRVIKYALQAKILYHALRVGEMIRLDDGIYRQFKHTVSGSNQIDLLLSYARDNGAIPLYLLYNYVSHTVLNGAACHVNFDVSQYGCSVVGAHYLKANYSSPTGNLKGNVRFSNLHPNHAVPWFMLACCLPNYTLPQTLKELGISLDYKPQLFNLSDIEEEGRNWNILGPVADSVTNNINNYKERPIDFVPKYRFVINIKSSE